MTSKLVIVAFAASLPLISLPAVAQEAYTTRIEPHRYYGAVVSLEAGVRVFRPLPPTRHVIINPDAQTPLTLSIDETRVYDQPRYNPDTGRRY